MSRLNGLWMIDRARALQRIGLLLLFASGTSILLSPAAVASDLTIFSGGFLDLNGGAQVWSARFGEFTGDQAAVWASKGGVVRDPNNVDVILPNVQHAEAQHTGVLGADFTYSAYITVSSLVDAHLQFRISDEGRYGVKVRTDSIVFYRFLRADKQCWSATSGFANHCPDWPPPPRCSPDQSIDNCDSPQYVELGVGLTSLVPGSEHLVAVTARGHEFDVYLDGAPVVFINGILAFSHIVDNLAGGPLSVGRFGVYVFGYRDLSVDPGVLSNVQFRAINATSDPTGRANFALLYSTAGYEAVGTKRALVRTLNDLPSESFNAIFSKFRLLASDNTVAMEGPLIPMPQAEPSLTAPAKTFGMQLWAADFSAETEPGTYTLSVDVAILGGSTLTLTSSSFQIAVDLITARTLKPLTSLDSEARRAADDDLRRNWIKRSGNWSVGVDGALIADRADAADGALLDRVFDDADNPLDPSKTMNFRMFGEITIVSGCDAQLQFRITPQGDRWAVTLQAGAGGGCPPGGPGAVRLHHEGGQDGYYVIAAALFPANAPFQAGHRYFVEILADGGSVSVWVDGALMLSNVQVPAVSGGYALKASASTVRFERVQVWNKDVPFAISYDGVLIPLFDLTVYDSQNQSLDLGMVPCQFQDADIPMGFSRSDDPTLEELNACNPVFSQLHGYNDCNNVIGEATSHGVFLGGLMQVWTSRAAQMTQDDRELLRRAIITTDLYLEEVYQEANPIILSGIIGQPGFASGGSAHQEMGRVAVGGTGVFNTLLNLYGSSAFADKGVYVDQSLAKRACGRSEALAQWLEQHNQMTEDLASVAYAHIARCVSREGSTIAGMTADAYWNKATAAVDTLLTELSTPGFIETQPRGTLDTIPWLEGVYEVLQQFPDRLNPDTLGRPIGYGLRLNSIADMLVGHLTMNHACTETLPDGPQCAANGFFVLPQASCNSGDTCTMIPAWNWQHMDQVPQDNYPQFGLKFLNWYDVTRFITSAQDAVFLGRMLGRDDLEPIASGSIYWTLGLNPGIPLSKVVNGAGDGVWGASTFVYDFAATPFARTFEGYRTFESSAKGWIADWEQTNFTPPPAKDFGSPHRETWWIDPLPNGFMSIVNGHMLWDGQWDYWNNGPGGWNSGETFLLNDGDFAKATTLFEDWMSPGLPSPADPYDTGRLGFFDTSHVDRFGTIWAFDDPVRTPWAQAARASNDFCGGKGFNGGRFTGHYIGERLGALCVSSRAQFFTVTQSDINAALNDGTGPAFTDVNTTPWALAQRAATRFCNSRQFVAGFFTGHQDTLRDGDPRGIFCLPNSDARWFDATEQDLYNSGYGFGDINAVAWDQAARAATNICLSKGFPGGFFTGEQILVNGQIPSLQGVDCFVPGAPNTLLPLLDRVFSVSLGLAFNGSFTVGTIVGAGHIVHVLFGPFFGDVQLILTRPDGTVVQPSDPNVTYNKTANSIEIIIGSAPSGVWQYQIIPVLLSTSTENIHLLVRDEASLAPDVTPPSVTATSSGIAGLGGWYRSDVTTTLAGTDNPGGWGVYGITYSATGAQVIPTINVPGPTASLNITAEGQSQISFFATDNAGNAGAVNTLAIKIDKTPPALAPAVIPNPVLLKGVATVNPNATDSLSGIVAMSCGKVDTSSVGQKSVTCTATDNAGNSAQAAASYRVIYRFDGFLQPINDTGHQQVCGSPCPASIFKGGSTIPVKFQLKDINGNVLQAASLPLWVTPQKGPVVTASVDETVNTVAATSGSTFRWDPTSRQYIYNWNTAGFAAGYYWRIGVQLDDGMIYYVTIGLK